MSSELQQLYINQQMSPREYLNSTPLKLALTLFLLGISWGTTPTRLYSQTEQITLESEESLRLLAKYQEKKGEVVLASGAVELHYRDLTLLADRIQLNTSTYEVLAEGSVTIQLPSEVVVCERLIYNLRTKEGQLQQVQAIARPTLLFGAQQIIRSADNKYDLEEAWLTTCTQPVPRWSFHFSKASLKPEEYVSMRQAVFRIKKLPLLYAPYLRYPLKDRATGFLFPQIGYNRVKGLSLSQSFYWSIARNMDATISVDFYSRKGLGSGLEYRYLFYGGTKGEISAYVFFFRKDPESVRPKPAYLIRFNHQQNFIHGFKLVAQVDYSSSFNFLREYESNYSLATVNNRSYQLNLSRSWAHFNLNLRSSRFETYFPQTGQSVTSAYLPQFSFNLLNYQIWPSTYLSFDSGVSNWQYSWKSPSGENNYELGNAYFRPGLSLALRPAHWANLTINAGGNFICYFQSYEEGTSNLLSRPLLTSQARLGLNLEGPFIYRIYFRHGEPHLKHLIAPFVSYLFDSALSEELLSRLVSPFGIFRNNDLKFGLTQHFLLKTQGSPQEILTAGLTQTVYFDPEHSPSKYYYPLNPDRHFSPLNAYLRFYPQAGFSLDVAADFNPYERNFLSSRISLNLGQPESNLFLTLNWSKNYQPIAPDSFFRSHQLGIQTTWRWPDRMDLKAQIELDLQNRQLLYSALAGVYHYQCLDFSFDLRIFYYRSKPEAQFRFSVGLGNISRTTDLLGALGF